jgi:division protein CdvB (Snf7/Vps24/ESCRT-III family)
MENEIKEIVNKASKFLTQSQLKDLRVNLLHGAWKQMYDSITDDYTSIENAVEEVEVV